MSKEQIEEMGKVVAEVQYLGGLEEKVAEHLYNVGYRKQIVGKWTYSENKKTMKCTRCRLRMKTYDVRRYCPNCGARMKGGAEQ